MICAITGEVPQEPVVSKKSGQIFERRAIEKAIETTGTDPTTKEPLALDDLVPIRVNKVAKPPRSTTNTSIPGLLQTFQNEWDALMLESYNLKQQLDSVRQELSHTLYQHDAACRVIARLIKERDEARRALAEFRATGQVSATNGEGGESMEGVENGITEDIKQRIKDTADALSKSRKKRSIPSSLATAEQIKEFVMKSTSSGLHQSTDPGISCVDVHPNEPIVVTGGVDHGVVVYNLDTKKTTHTFAREHTKQVNEVQFVAPANPEDGTRRNPTLVLSCSKDKTAKVWKVGQEASLHTVKVHSANVTGISLQATGGFFATASEDRTWGFHDLNSGNTLAQIQGETAFQSLRFHPDGMILGTGSSEGVVQIWDIKSQKNVASFEGHKGKVVDISFSENGYYLATAAEDNTVRLWDLRKTKNFQTITLDAGYGLNAIDWDWSGTYLAVSGADIRVYVGKTANHIATFSKHSAPVTDVKWGQDAQYLVSVSMDRSIKLWRRK